MLDYYPALHKKLSFPDKIFAKVTRSLSQEDPLRKEWLLTPELSTGKIPAWQQSPESQKHQQNQLYREWGSNPRRQMSIGS